jgi:hypothetical protein
MYWIWLAEKISNFIDLDDRASLLYSPMAPALSSLLHLMRYVLVRQRWALMALITAMQSQWHPSWIDYKPGSRSERSVMASLIHQEGQKVLASGGV